MGFSIRFSSSTQVLSPYGLMQPPLNPLIAKPSATGCARITNLFCKSEIKKEICGHKTVMLKI
jgi:hypothetical protein